MNSNVCFFAAYLHKRSIIVQYETFGEDTETVKNSPILLLFYLISFLHMLAITFINNLILSLESIGTVVALGQKNWHSRNSTGISATNCSFNPI